MKKNDLKWINAFQEHSEHSSSHLSQFLFFNLEIYYKKLEVEFGTSNHS